MNINELRFLSGVISEETYYHIAEAEMHPVQDKNVLANWMRSALDEVIKAVLQAGPDAYSVRGDLEHIDKLMKTMAGDVEMGNGLDTRQATAMANRLRQMTSPAAMADQHSANRYLKPYLNKLENIALELEKEVHKAKGTWAS